MRSIRRMLRKTLVPVNSATSSALVETGEQRSPKYTPESTAPPVSTMGTPMARPSAAQITPMVAAVPKDVPVSTESRQLSRNTMTRKHHGRMNPTAQQTIMGMVPAARQRAVSIPMSRKIVKILRTERTPPSASAPSSRHEKPFFLPYSRKRASPAPSAHKMDAPSATQQSSSRQKIPSTASSMKCPPRFFLSA